MHELAVVTGGARGLGLGIVQSLLANKVAAEVVVLDRDPAELSEAQVIQCDVTDEKAVRRVAAEIGRVPGVLINNAGGNVFQDDMLDPFGPVEVWRKNLDLNLTSAYLVTSVFGPNLNRGSVICNTASIGALTAIPGALHAYAAGKAALAHWTRNLAVALGPRGIRVNAVAPGLVWTRLWESFADREAFDEMVRRATVLGEPQTTEDVAECVAFLCSDRSSQITGQLIAIDGGASLVRQYDPV